MRERSDFSLCASERFGMDESGMYRKHSSSSNSSSSAATSPNNQPTAFFDDSSPQSSSTTSPPLPSSSTDIIPITAVAKREPIDTYSEAWRGTYSPINNRDLPKNVCPASCEICGDNATGYHYEVASCNGCKTFFRRAVLGQRNFSCKKNGECKNSMNKEIRVKCRACRFDRCVEAGMNPLAILSETNPEGNKVVREILSKRKLLPESLCEQPSTSRAAEVKLFVHPQVMENTIDRMIDELLHLEIAYDKIRKSNYDIPFDQHKHISITECLKGHSKLGMDYGVAPIRTEPFKKPPVAFIPIELRIRDRIPFKRPPPPTEIWPEGAPKIWHVLDMIHAVEYLKTFDFFHQIVEADQKTLAKHVVLMTVIITNSFYSFEAKSDCTVHPDGFFPHFGQIPQEAEHDRKMHYETVQRVKQMNLDKKEYVLLKALMACNPAIEDLSTASREIMQERRDKYAKSLMSYIMARRGFREGPQMYAELMAYVDWLTRLVQKNKDLHVLICALGLRDGGGGPAPIMDEVFGA